MSLFATGFSLKLAPAQPYCGWVKQIYNNYIVQIGSLHNCASSNAGGVWAEQAPPERLDEAKAAGAEWAKSGPHSVQAESCTPIREPMKQKYLDDLRKAGLPDRAERVSP